MSTLKHSYTITKLQLRKSSAIIYKQTVGSRNVGNRYQLNKNSNDIHKTYNGKVNKHTQKRIRRAVDILSQISDWQKVYNPITMKNDVIRLVFITLTIPNSTIKPTGKQGYQQLLKPFIQTMKRLHNMHTYIWKAELQKNGMIHYHITTNTFIRYDIIKKRWNELLTKHNYLTDYYTKHLHYDANSTDVHKVYNDNMIEAYLEKYISKVNDDELSIIGKVWDCSQDLKGAKYFTTDFREWHIPNIHKLSSHKDYYCKIEDHFTIHKFNRDCITQILYGYEHTLYNEWKQAIKLSAERNSV